MRGLDRSLRLQARLNVPLPPFTTHLIFQHARPYPFNSQLRLPRHFSRRPALPPPHVPLARRLCLLLPPDLRRPLFRSAPDHPLRHHPHLRLRHHDSHLHRPPRPNPSRRPLRSPPHLPDAPPHAHAFPANLAGSDSHQVRSAPLERDRRTSAHLAYAAVSRRV